MSNTATSEIGYPGGHSVSYERDGNGIKITYCLYGETRMEMTADSYNDLLHAMGDLQMVLTNELKPLRRKDVVEDMGEI